MEITSVFVLSKREERFLRALKRKSYPKNNWSGRGTDDEFIRKWEHEIETFEKANLTEKKDSGYPEDYWCFGLNKNGLIVQDLILKKEKVLEIKINFLKS